MIKAYGVTALIALMVGLPLAVSFAAGPVTDHRMIVGLYGGLVSFTVYLLCWSMIPKRWGGGRSGYFVVCLGALALGVNTAYAQVSFKDQTAQAVVATDFVQFVWLGNEFVLAVWLIIYVYRWKKQSSVMAASYT